MARSSTPSSPRRRRSLHPVSKRPAVAPTTRIAPNASRLLIVWGLLVGAIGGLILNLYYVQIKQGPVLQALAQQQQMILLRPFVPRRNVVDRTGTVLAMDRPVYSLFAHPKLFKEPPEAIAAQIAPILQKPAADILKRFREADSGIRLEYAIAEDVAERIMALQIDGLERIQLQQRFYPQKELLANVLGYVNADHKGQAGIELSQQNLLERTVKAVRLTRMGDGSLMPDQVPGGFLNVDDLRLKLTLDTRLQRVAMAALKQQVKRYNAKRGVVIVMDAHTGAIRAMASEPSFDPNKFYDFPLDRFKNWALTDLYEPGSTFKPISVAIALEEGVVQPTDTVNDSGQLTIDGWPVGNAGDMALGTISITEVIKYSSNVGTIRVIQKMPANTFYDWLMKLGLGKPVGIDLPGEVGGQFKSREVFTSAAIEPAVTAFGQGFSLTPIQLVQLHAALANGGKLVTPHVVDGLYNSNQDVYWQPKRQNERRIFSPETTKAMLLMMEAVVKDGTGKTAQIPGYRIAGKTGTAQKALPSGGYSDNAKITSFVGIFPVEAPRYVVLAVVDEPQGGRAAAGSTVAAPVVKTVIEGIITLEKIPPSTAAQ